MSAAEYQSPVFHDYLSTACFHRECGSCRNTCKHCSIPCSCTCHTRSAVLPRPWVDQARDIAAELLAALGSGVPAGLAQRIAQDPDLFWLRGEAKPPGEWHPR